MSVQWLDNRLRCLSEISSTIKSILKHMKLHLPKLLSVTLMAVYAAPAMALSTSDVKHPYDNATTTDVKEGNSYLDVGYAETGSYNIFSDGAWKEVTWDGNLTVGDTTDENNNVVQGDVDYVGRFNSDWSFKTLNGGTTYTNSLNVKGTLKIQGNGKLVLGGQPVKNKFGSTDNYQGLTATAIEVIGGTLTSTKIITNNLTVSGGNVSTSTSGCTSGSGYTVGNVGPKQSYIKNSITLSGGDLDFGYHNAQGIGGGNHRMTAFGSSNSFTITQTGGNMNVMADADMRAGTTITQSSKAANMIFRDQLNMSGSGQTTINQSGDTAKLSFGHLKGSDSNTFQVNQSGKGVVTFAYGSNFSQASTINLVQTGAGTINIGGGHDASVSLSNNHKNSTFYKNGFESTNTTYNISQTGSGMVHLKENATITVKDLTVNSSSSLKVDGHMTVTGIAKIENDVLVGAKASFTFAESASMVVSDGLNLAASNTLNFNVGELDSATGTMQMGEDSNMEITGAKLTLELSDVVIQQMATEATFEGTTYHITLISSISDTDMGELALILNDALYLEDFYKELPVTLAATSTKPITIASQGLILEDNSLKAVVVATNENLIPEPATATLSLLALAALAARRRRK